VRDEGPGVPASEQERIFERFARVHRGPRRGGAAGLGLAIVTTVAQAHGGRVLLDSAPGQGARFTIVVQVGAEVA
jgi:signal transduction histidine kinase